MAKQKFVTITKVIDDVEREAKVLAESAEVWLNKGWSAKESAAGQQPDTSSSEVPQVPSTQDPSPVVVPGTAQVQVPNQN